MKRNNFPPVEELLSRACLLLADFDQHDERHYIDEAIALDRAALDFCIPGNAQWSACLSQLSTHLSIRFRRLGRVDDLDEAILLDREALTLRPLGSPDRPEVLNALAVDLFARYLQLGEVDDLNEAILTNREALTLWPLGQPDRSHSFNNLAMCLSTRYKQLGGVEDLHEAILLSREALSLRPPGHPEHAQSLSNLAVSLTIRYKQLGGEIRDLDEAILLNREALSFQSPNHPRCSIALNNLAVNLFTRYSQTGETDDLNEAVLFSREALLLRPPGNLYRASTLNNLASYLCTRYDQLGGLEDLDEGILLDKEALTLRPPGHPDRAQSLSNLATELSARYEKLREVKDLNEAILLDREALALRLPGHPDRFMSLINLGGKLSTRYKLHQSVDDLSEAILFDREAVTLCPPGHLDRSMSLNNLAVHLFTLYEKLEEVDNLNEAIRLNWEALALRPLGNPNRSTSLDNLAGNLSARYKLLNDTKDQDQMFTLYTELTNITETISLHDLTATKSWIDVAEQFHHPTTLLAYQTALRLLVQHLTTLPLLPQHLTVFKSLTSTLAVDAFSACLRNRSLTTAVELLEQGRGVFWNQLSRLRSPLDAIIESGPTGKKLADQFQHVTSLIRDSLDSPGTDQHDRVCHLNLELQKIVSGIRDLPGLSRFLLPQTFLDLRRAASVGPVIILNASKYGCDALVVFADKDPLHIPLPIAKQKVVELSSTLRDLVKLAKRSDVTKELSIFLRDLWDKVVSPVADSLRTTLPRQSRIWWCPTAEFSLLPLHAANPFRKGQPSLAGLYVSSYTTTLSALIRARQPALSTSTPEEKRFVAIGQANAAGTSKLPNVSIELVNVGKRVDGLVTFTLVDGKESCISRMTEELGKNEFVHVACHGLPNRKRPFESAFGLHDGRLTIQHIMKSELKHSEFAYLSACHTTVGDEESPDEVIHLASTMQFIGFRSVIGTMWGVDDAETIKITSMFYKHMVDESRGGGLDHTRAAFALRKTVKSMDVPLDQRILYVHIGA